MSLLDNSTSSIVDSPFCDDFWDWDLSWHTDSPDLTRCFQNTALAWTPSLFIFLLSPLDIFSSFHSTGRNIPFSPLNICKTVLTLLLIGLQLGLVGHYFVRDGDGYYVYPVELYTPLIRTATFILVIFLIHFTRVKGVRSSTVQFLYWTLMLFCEVFAFRTSLLHYNSNPPIEETFEFVIRMIFYPVVVCMFLLSCWADLAPLYQESPTIGEKACPEEEASVLSQILFFWFEPLAWRGYRKPLEYSDLWQLNQVDKSSSISPIFDKHWKKALESAKKVSDGKASFNAQSGSIDLEKIRKSGSKKEEASIFKTLVKSFWLTFTAGAILKLLQDLLTFVSPQILRLLISFVSNKNDEDAYVWKGYFYAALLVASSIIQTLFLNQYFHRMFLVGMRIRTALVSAIYRKALLISSAARKESTVGEIVNLMSVDAQRLMDLVVYLNMLWSAPFQIALSLYFLWGTLGPSVLAGLAVMILLIPINAYLASRLKNLQIRQMKWKDGRVKLVNEILSGIKVLKLYAWEPSFESQVVSIREKEIKVLKQAAYLSAAASFLWTMAPFLVAVVSFATYVLSDESNILDAQKAFVSVALFNILRFPLSMLPMVISTIVQASVSMKRLNKFMNSEEINPNAVSHDPSERDPVVIENGNFSWTETPILKNINLRVKDGSLVAICGAVGSGKSSILSAILGDMDKETGRVNTKGSIAYVAQQAWIQNATVRDNILFGRPFEESKYEQVLAACALKQDLDILPAGDKTEIGEKGINLSGGQKQRVSLARAVYNNADIYLLDDPLSAVDSHVGKHIFENVLGPSGLLKNKTRVLVTHGLTYLPSVDKIVVMKEGRVTEEGSYRELLEKKEAFAEFLTLHLGSDEGEEVGDGENSLLEDIDLALSGRKKMSESEGGDKNTLTRQMSVTSQTSSGKNSIRKLSKSVESPKEKSANGEVGKKLIEVEKSETGSVKLSVYMYYIKAVGWAMTISTLFFQCFYQVLAVLSNVWLSEWANSNEGKNVTLAKDDSERNLYLGVYAGLGVGQAIFILLSSLSLALGFLQATKFLHSQMMKHLLRAPSSFFDTTPIGRIVNRCAKDVDTCDSVLPQSFRSFISCTSNVVATVSVISYSTPIFMTVIFPIGIIYFLVQRFYVATSRQLKRLESVSRSPIYSHFGETLTGSTTIRAYMQQERFILESERKVDHNQLSYFPSIVANRWLAVRLETVGNFVIFFAALFAVLGRDSLDGGLVGLSISYALNVTQYLNWLVRMTSDVEANVVAVERIKEYCEVEQEADWEISGKKPPKSWPEAGEITFDHYQTRYREGLSLVLKNVTCNIKPAEKVGIVGRTGAGKSSLTLSLFRIIEGAGGKIIIDGQDISQLGLHDVRGRLTIIPQDPVLFSGSLRMNLDPFESYTDDVIWRALSLAHLKNFVETLSAGLLHQVSEGGDNLSVGQRQLICLARALLRKTKILVLDEATAAVDLETDDLIQQTIRSEFNDSTVVTIAHRLNTIMDSNRVMVLDKGQITEFDSPQKLLSNKTSVFYSMAKDAGLV